MLLIEIQEAQRALGAPSPGVRKPPKLFAGEMLQAAYALVGFHLFTKFHFHPIHLPLMAEYDQDSIRHWF